MRRSTVVKPSPQGKVAAKRPEEVFHAGRFFPEWDHVESKSPSSGFALLTHLPPRGKAADIEV